MPWSDEYLPLLLQLYLKTPAGVKPMYSRGLVDLALLLHVSPRQVYAQMFRLRRRDTPRIERLWQQYGDNPRRLARDAKTVRQTLDGFGQPDTFYEGVEICSGWENDFLSLHPGTTLTPVALILTLDLYFRLTPATMTADTPEVAELARTVGAPAADLVAVMHTYMTLDPYLRRHGQADPRWTAACTDIWHRYAADDPERLATAAACLHDYYKK